MGWLKNGRIKWWWGGVMGIIKGGWGNNSFSSCYCSFVVVISTPIIIVSFVFVVSSLSSPLIYWI